MRQKICHVPDSKQACNDILVDNFPISLFYEDSLYCNLTHSLPQYIKRIPKSCDEFLSQQPKWIIPLVQKKYFHLSDEPLFYYI